MADAGKPPSSCLRSAGFPQQPSAGTAHTDPQPRHRGAMQHGLPPPHVACFKKKIPPPAGTALVWVVRYVWPTVFPTDASKPGQPVPFLLLRHKYH